MVMFACLIIRYSQFPVIRPVIDICRVVVLYILLNDAIFVNIINIEKFIKPHIRSILKLSIIILSFQTKYLFVCIHAVLTMSNMHIED